MVRDMDPELLGGEASQLLTPRRLFSRPEVLSRPSPVPAIAGVYAWYFDAIPPHVPVDGCRVVDGHALLYVGISPRKPGADGLKPSRQTMRTRVRYHYRGNAYGSTLRLTLGSLLAAELDLQLRRVGSGARLTFSAGEEALSQWMSDHARVCWVETAIPWTLEHELIETLVLPLTWIRTRTPVSVRSSAPFVERSGPRREASRCCQGSSRSRCIDASWKSRIRIGNGTSLPLANRMVMHRRCEVHAVQLQVELPLRDGERDRVAALHPVHR